MATTSKTGIQCKLLGI